MYVIYSSLCPVCGEDLTLDEALKGTCFKTKEPLCGTDRRYLNFIRFFTKAIGEPRTIQRMWAKRMLNGESFAAVAPTGVGKTSFGIIASLFLAKEGRKSYIILPTTLLLEQVVSSIQRYSKSLGLECGFNELEGEIRVAYYHGRLKKNEKERFFEVVKEVEILVTTTQFLSKHFSDISGTLFDFIFVDDVDAILKASKNVERVLQLLGFRFENEWKRGEKTGSLMVSTATAKKGRKAELFRNLLNFDIGSSTFAVRNIEDIALRFSDLEILDVLERVLENMGGGGLIFTRTVAEMEKIYEFLKSKFRVGLGNKQGDFDKFRNSELDYLLGTSYYYGSLVRGLDLPERIRYAVFVGIPVFRLRFEDLEDPSKVNDRIVRLLLMLLKESEEVRESEDYKKLERLEFGRKEVELRKFLKKVLKELKVRRLRDAVLKENELLIPDVRTYIQASGRTSRLYSGGITKGVSFVLEDDGEILNAFRKRAEYFDIDLSIRELEEVDFDRLRKEVDESRKRFGTREKLDLIKPALFIVESPVKARQISRFFGRPSIRILDGMLVYEVPTAEYILQITASLGHITDLITNRGFHGVEILNSNFVPIFSSIKRCLSCGYQFTHESEKCPRCGGEVSDSKKRIESLRKLAYESEKVIIGTDPDSEGEKIAWDLRNLLSGCGEIKRAEFHEVTKKAIDRALGSLREVDENLVKAQILRRVEDRWIGFVLSLKLQEVFKDRNLSAGRAQSPVLGWILERTKESKRKKVIALIEDLDLIIEDLEISEVGEREVDLEIELVEVSETKRTPLPPYTTDTLLRDANRILKLNATQAMKIAQDLFENGLITYHRTDSTRVSDTGLRIAKDYLGNEFYPREWFAEGAHECIRPTRPLDKASLQRLIYEGVIRAEEVGKAHLSLYDLIFRRFMASQCRNFVTRVAKYRIEVLNKVFDEERVLEAKGKAFELYKSVYVKKELPVGRIRTKAIFRKIPKALPFSEAEVVQLMKSKGIGRPSTYAIIIERLFRRGYVVEKNGKVVGTRRGFVVYDFLSKNYSDLVSEERTRILEEKMDRVANGELSYFEALKELYEEIKGIS